MSASVVVALPVLKQPPTNTRCLVLAESPALRTLAVVRALCVDALHALRVRHARILVTLVDVVASTCLCIEHETFGTDASGPVTFDGFLQLFAFRLFRAVIARLTIWNT